MSTESSTYQENVDHPEVGRLDIDDAMDRLGMGKFQRQVAIVAGLCFAADAMEIILLSFLTVVLQVEWDLSQRATDSIFAGVFAGALIGVMVLGPLGDKIGRKPIFSATAAIIAIFGLATAAAPNYGWFMFVRLVVGFGLGGLAVPFDTLAEFIPNSYRGRILLYTNFFWTGGTMLVPIFASWTFGRATPGSDDERFSSSWRLFVILCAIPCAISALLAIMYVPESPRWLVSQGKQEKALAILRHAAKVNGNDPLKMFPDGTLLTQSESSQHEKEASVRDLFSPKWLKITILLWIAWFGMEFLYFGAVLEASFVFSSSVDSSAVDFDYAAILISSSAEIFGVLVVLQTVDRWGRIPTISGSWLVAGVFSLLLGLLENSSSRNFLIFLAFVARMMVMGAACTTWITSSEVWTTDIRTTGHGAAYAIGRVGAFVAPFIISSGNSMQMIGIATFVVSLLVALTSWYLPETNGKVLGETEANTTTNRIYSGNNLDMDSNNQIV